MFGGVLLEGGGGEYFGIEPLAPAAPVGTAEVEQEQAVVVAGFGGGGGEVVAPGEGVGGGGFRRAAARAEQDGQ